MSEYKIVIKDEEFLNDLNRLNSEFPEATKSVLKELAAESVIVIKRDFVPVVTGNLRSTIRVLDESDDIGVSAGGIEGRPVRGDSVLVNYAEYVNWGSSKQTPQFFMEKGVEVAFNQTDSVSKKILKSWIDNV